MFFLNHETRVDSFCYGETQHYASVTFLSFDKLKRFLNIPEGELRGASINEVLSGIGVFNTKRTTLKKIDVAFINSSNGRFNIHQCIYPTPPQVEGCGTKSIFKLCLTGLKSEFSFSLTGCLNKATIYP